MNFSVIGASAAAAVALVAALGASANVLDQTEQSSVPANAPIAIVDTPTNEASSTDLPLPADGGDSPDRPTPPPDTSPTPDVVPDPVSPSDDDRQPPVTPRPTDDDDDIDDDDDEDDNDDVTYDDDDD